MAGAITLTIPEASLRQAKLKGLPQRLRRAHKRVLAKAATEAVNYAQATYRDAARTTDIATVRRTGELRKRYQWRPGAETANSVEVEWGMVQGSQPLRYGRMQELGGVVRAKPGKFLAIPLDAVKTARGVARTTARDAMQNPPRGFDKTFFLRSKRNPDKAFIMGQRRNGKDMEPLFVLVRQVKVPARPAIAPTMRHMRPRVIEALQDATNEVLRAPD